MDYDTLIDAETWAFIRMTEASYPENAASLSIQDQRALYDQMCTQFRQPRPDGIDTKDLNADGVPVRVYTAGHPTRTVMYFHGGGFVVGGLDSHDDVCADICAKTGYRVVSVDYRLSPEHPHPAAFDDSWAATQWAAREYNTPIVLAGDSAGACLAACTAHYARGRLDTILGQVLIYPGLGGDLNSVSHLDHAQAPMLNRNDVLFYKDIRLANGQTVETDPTYLPLQDTDFTNLPPTIVFTADCDPLRDDGTTYCKALSEAGTQAHCINEPGLTHGYLRARTLSTRAADSFERIEIAIEALGQSLWPYED